MTDKKTFTLKLIAFLISSLVLPITYLAIRFNLFQTTTKTTISFWAVVVIGLILAVLGVMIKYYISGLKTRYTFAKQLLEGIVKVILPIGMILVIVVAFKHNYEAVVEKLDLVIEAIVVLLICESIAICVNPLPKWAFENNVEGLAEITDKLFKKGDTE